MQMSCAILPRTCSATRSGAAASTRFSPRRRRASAEALSGLGISPVRASSVCSRSLNWSKFSFFQTPGGPRRLPTTLGFISISFVFARGRSSQPRKEEKACLLRPPPPFPAGATNPWRPSPAQASGGNRLLAGTRMFQRALDAPRKIREPFTKPRRGEDNSFSFFLWCCDKGDQRIPEKKKNTKEKNTAVDASSSSRQPCCPRTSFRPSQLEPLTVQPARKGPGVEKASAFRPRASPSCVVFHA